MPLKTRNVLVKLLTPAGRPMVGISVVSTLVPGYDVDTAGIVVPRQVVGATDADGLAVLQLWPNVLGQRATRHRIQARDTNSAVLLDVMAVVPDGDEAESVRLADIVIDTPMPAANVLEFLAAKVKGDAADVRRIAASLANGGGLDASAIPLAHEIISGDLMLIFRAGQLMLVAAGTATPDPEPDPAEEVPSNATLFGSKVIVYGTAYVTADPAVVADLPSGATLFQNKAVVQGDAFVVNQ